MNRTPRPPLAGSDADLLALRTLFDRAGYNEPSLCARLALSSLEDDRQVRARSRRLAPADACAVLARLLAGGLAVAAADVEAALSPAELTALGAVNLVHRADGASGPVYRAAAALAPVAVGADHFWIAADLPGGDGEAEAPAADIVFSGHNPLTRQFVRFLPGPASGEVLELCSGTAIGALTCARTAARVVAVDIARRSTDFATFNSWLNAGSGVVPLTGDLYAPVAGEAFDWVIAHPPYVPTTRDKAIYRDGGTFGDDIVRRIVEGLPDHLRPGGRFYLLTLGLDRVDAPFEQRVRRWLGPAGRGIDLLFAVGELKPVEDLVRLLVDRDADAEPEDRERWLARFAGDGVHSAVYGALVGRRFDPAAGAEQTRRVPMPPSPRAWAFDWAFEWFDWLRQPDRLARLMASRPVLSPRCEVQVRYRMQDGGLLPEEFRLENADAPFPAEMRTDGWVVALLGSFDGRRTVQEILEQPESGAWPEGLTAETLADLVCVFAERRIVALDAGQPPRVAAS